MRSASAAGAAGRTAAASRSSEIQRAATQLCRSAVALAASSSGLPTSFTVWPRNRSCLKAASFAASAGSLSVWSGDAAAPRLK